MCTRKRDRERKRKKDHSVPTKTLTSLNVALVERKAKRAARARWMHFATSPARILDETWNSRRGYFWFAARERQLRWQRSATWNSSSRINSVLAMTVYAENSRANWLLTTGLSNTLVINRRVGYQRRGFAHNNNIVGCVVRHEQTRLDQLRQLRSPPVVEHKSTARSRSPSRL